MKIEEYELRPAEFREYDREYPIVAARVAKFIRKVLPEADIEHVGSTAAPGCGGKGVVDLLLLYPPGALEPARNAIDRVGFQRQRTGNPFPETRPMRTGAVRHKGRLYRIHVHVLERGAAEANDLLEFRDTLRRRPDLVASYCRQKRALIESGIKDTGEYSRAKGSFVEQSLTAARGK